MLFISLVLLDQLTKYLIRFRQSADGGFYICNPNVSFGIPVAPILFWILWAIFIFILLYIGFKITKTKSQTLPSGRQVSNKLQNQILKEQTSGFKFRNWDLKHYLEIKNWKLKIKKTYPNKELLILLGLTFILSGGISNALDRFFHGCVIDFINLHIWPIFNLADIFITLGAIMIVLTVFRNKS